MQCSAVQCGAVCATWERSADGRVGSWVFHSPRPRLRCCRAGALAEVDEALRRKQKAEAEAADRMLTDVVGPEEVAAVVSKWTGIPVTKLQASRWGRWGTKSDAPDAQMPHGCAVLMRSADGLGSCPADAAAGAHAMKGRVVQTG